MASSEQGWPAFLHWFTVPNPVIYRLRHISILLMTQLEHKFQSKLNLTRRSYRARDDTPVRRNNRIAICVDTSECDKPARHGKVRVVRQIEELRSEFDSPRFRDRKEF